MADRIARNGPTARRIVYWRERAGLKKAALARAAGVTKGAVTRWERAETAPRNLKDVADALGIALRVFWADIDDSL